MAANEFNFIEAYRIASPQASRELVDARQKSHDKLYPIFVKSMERVYEACRLAFQLPQNTAGLAEWFEKTIKEFDPQFSMELDKAEAGRIASLLLRDLMFRGSPQCAFAVLICSFCGLRAPVDGELLPAARQAVTQSARERRIVLQERKISAPSTKDLKAELDAMQQSWNQNTARAAIEAAASDFKNGLTKTAGSANDAHQALRGDVVRLAEEVDMLWWAIGDWSDLLDQPRANLHKETIGIVSGIELGNFVRNVPGPYGAYGILRRTLGKVSERKAKLKDAVSALGKDANKLARDLPQSAMAVFPVHAAIRLAVDQGADVWPAAFDQLVGSLKDGELTHFELAIQGFRERVLINWGGLGQ